MMADTNELNSLWLGGKMGLLDLLPEEHIFKKILLVALYLPIVIGIALELFQIFFYNRQKSLSDSDESSIGADFSITMSSLQNRENSSQTFSNQDQVQSLPTSILDSTRTKFELNSSQNVLIFSLLTLSTFVFSSIYNFFTFSMLKCFHYVCHHNDICQDDQMMVVYVLYSSPLLAILILGLVVLRMKPKYPWPLGVSSLPILFFAIIQKYPKFVHHSWQLKFSAFSLTFVFLLIPFALFFTQHHLKSSFKLWQVLILTQNYIVGKNLFCILQIFNPNLVKSLSILFLTDAVFVVILTFLLFGLLTFKSK